MKTTPFKGLFPKLKLKPAKKPRSAEDRLRQVETDIADLRGVVRELIETLERELFRDLDGNRRIGKVTPKRGLPKTARITPLFSDPVTRMRKRHPNPLPPNIP